MKGLKLTALGLAAASVVAGAAQAEVRLSLGVYDAHPFYKPLQAFGEALTAAGVETRVYSTQILGNAQAASGVRDGIVDGAMVLFPYFPNEYSESNLTAEVAMLASSGTPSALPGGAMEGATMEYIFLNCPDCQAQFKAQNMVYVSGTSSSQYATVCAKPVSTAADLVGKRIRTGAGNYQRIAEAMGATSVSMMGTEVFDALNQGVIDCTMQPASSILDFRYVDIAKSILLGYPGGAYSGIALPGFNRDTWQKLTTEQRAAALKAGPKIAADGYFANLENDDLAIAAGRDAGMSIFEADAELRAKIDAFIEQDLETIKKEQTTNFKLNDVDGKIAKIRELLEKWKGLTNEPGMNKEKLAQLYWDQIFSKVDPATYGMD